MAQLTIRNLDEQTVRRLKQLAAENGRSLEAELRHLLGRMAAGEIALAEEAPLYDVTTRVARSRVAAQSFGPPERVRLPRATPLTVKGKRVSERLIEDRR